MMIHFQTGKGINQGKGSTNTRLLNPYMSGCLTCGIGGLHRWPKWTVSLHWHQHGDFSPGPIPLCSLDSALATSAAAAACSWSSTGWTHLSRIQRGASTSGEKTQTAPLTLARTGAGFIHLPVAKSFQQTFLSAEGRQPQCLLMAD